MTIAVLYIDDEMYHLEIAKTFLERSGECEVDTASSGKEALEKMKGKVYDAVVSDYMMPDMDGISLLKTVRKRHGLIPFIIYTGKGKEDVVIEALNNGADYYLRKGDSPTAVFTELERRIREAVQRRWAEEELRASEDKYRSVVEDQIELIVRYLPDMRIIFANEAFCSYFDLSKDECAGTQFLPFVVSEDLGALKSLHASLNKDNLLGHIELKIAKPDGQVRSQRWNTRAIVDENGKIVEFQSVGRDVTDRNSAEQALRKQETQYLEVSHVAPKSSTDIDEQYHITYIVANSPAIGNFPLRALIDFTSQNSTNGIGVIDARGRKVYLVIIQGEVEGAIYIDESGALYGDNALLMVKGGEVFTLHNVDRELAERLVTGCRVFEKNHLNFHHFETIPDIGKKKKGIGVLQIIIMNKNQPVQGIKVSLLSRGKVVGNDTTTKDGKVSFRLFYDAYTCVLLDQSRVRRQTDLTFNETHERHTLDLSALQSMS